MKNFIKTFRIELAVVVVLSALLIFAFNKPVPKVESVRTVRQLITDSTQTVQAKAIISKKDSVIRVLWSRLITTKSGLAKIKAQNKGLKQINDTLLASYKNNRTFAICDSLVEVQQEVINGLSEENDSLEVEAQQYSLLANTAIDKCAVLDELVTTKQKTIDIQQSEIERLKCATNWGFRHRFWKFIFGFNCKN